MQIHARSLKSADSVYFAADNTRHFNSLLYSELREKQHTARLCIAVVQSHWRCSVIISVRLSVHHILLLNVRACGVRLQTSSSLTVGFRALTFRVNYAKRSENDEKQRSHCPRRLSVSSRWEKKKSERREINHVYALNSNKPDSRSCTRNGHLLQKCEDR